MPNPITRRRRAHWSRLWMLLIAAALVVSACGGESEEAESGPPQMRVQALSTDGEMMVIDNLRGVDTMLWFWAPW